MFQQQQQQQQPPPPQQQMDQGQSPPINFRVILNRDEVAFLFGFDGVLLGQLRQQGRDSHLFTYCSYRLFYQSRRIPLYTIHPHISR